MDNVTMYNQERHDTHRLFPRIKVPVGGGCMLVTSTATRRYGESFIPTICCGGALIKQRLLCIKTMIGQGSCIYSVVGLAVPTSTTPCNSLHWRWMAWEAKPINIAEFIMGPLPKVSCTLDDEEQHKNTPRDLSLSLWNQSTTTDDKITIWINWIISSSLGSRIL